MIFLEISAAVAAESARFLPAFVANATDSMAWIFVDIVRSAVRATRRPAEGDDNGTNGEDGQDEGGEDHQGRVHALFD
jgi:hypothetical protein